jgi:hypothetical protein
MDAAESGFIGEFVRSASSSTEIGVHLHPNDASGAK